MGVSQNLFLAIRGNRGSLIIPIRVSRRGESNYVGKYRYRPLGTGGVGYGVEISAALKANRTITSPFDYDIFMTAEGKRAFDEGWEGRDCIHLRWKICNYTEAFQLARTKGSRLLGP